MMIEFLWFLGFVLIYGFLAIKKIDKNERLIIFSGGKPSRVSGPGVVVTWPGLQSSRLLDMRACSMPLPKIFLPGISQSTLVSGSLKFSIFDPLKAASIANTKAATEQVVQATLLSVLSNATIKQCLKESFVLESQALDMVNAQTKTWGVNVSELKLTEFPQHRMLLSQLAGLLGAPATQISAIIEKVAKLRVENEC